MWVALSDLDLIITMIHNINSVVMEELKLIGAYYLYLHQNKSTETSNVISTLLKSFSSILAELHT